MMMMIIVIRWMVVVSSTVSASMTMDLVHWIRISVRSSSNSSSGSDGMPFSHHQLLW